MPFAKITQVAHYVPENIVSNDDLAKIMDTVTSGFIHGRVLSSDTLQLTKIPVIWLLRLVNNS